MNLPAALLLIALTAGAASPAVMAQSLAEQPAADTLKLVSLTAALRHDSASLPVGGPGRRARTEQPGSRCTLLLPAGSRSQPETSPDPALQEAALAAA